MQTIKDSPQSPTPVEDSPRIVERRAPAPRELPRSRGISAWSHSRLEKELLDRYARMGPLSGYRRFRYHGRRLAWAFVTTSTHFVKRLIDMSASGSAMLLLSPACLFMIVLIKLDSPGPAFFGQNRVGRYGKLFKMWKFRSMYTDAEKRKDDLLQANEMSGGVTFKMKSDPRVTRVGRFIRKTSIDELPQLWNVFCGDMSLVGPRPPVPREVAEYSLSDRRRLEVTPGITCIWQVSGRSDIPFDQQVELDVAYIESQSFWLDVKLLFKTIPAVLLGKGAY